jgi:hypothetical protein
VIHTAYQSIKNFGALFQKILWVWYHIERVAGLLLDVSCGSKTS